ncbi:hypothetical protein [Sulfoacidibacillus ferrooxidans]|uniref:Peptidase M48 domain-containing protein n=1 Tax=Sulfoacidibacillus ferrooxidans TaxID=2005001 RepID=A0A9X2ABF3_9BACL|nr:hypothetical protein [Sulfoacidibacillus ferrooxidans]MCI0182903.1 hypothetical protein [Sulfoacidibacillus ferrooxidans]
METTTTTCKSCGSEIPFHQGYVTWCECGWHLELPLEWKENKSLKKWYQRVAEVHQDMIAQSHAHVHFKGPQRFVVTMTIIVVISLAIYIGLAIALFQVHLWLVTLLGLLLIAGLLIPIQAAWKFPSSTNTIIDRKHAPLTFEQMDQLTTTLDTAPIHHICIEQHGFHIRATQPWLRRTTVLTISLPLLSMLDDELLLLSMAREQLIQHSWHHSRIASGQWAQIMLDTAYEIIMNETHAEHLGVPDEPEQEDNLTDQYRTVVRHAKRRSMIRSFRLLSIPFALIPKSLSGMMAQQLTLLIHQSIYEVNAKVSERFGDQVWMRYIQMLSLAEPIAYYSNVLPKDMGRVAHKDAVLNTLSTMPERERERLLRTAPEDGLIRPMLWWQVTYTQKVREHPPISLGQNQHASSIVLSPSSKLCEELIEQATRLQRRDDDFL